MIYAGIDYSINCPCLCIYNSELGQLNHSSCEYYFATNKMSEKEQKRISSLNLEKINFIIQYQWDNNYSRYLALADYFVSILIQYDVKIVAMEDYALGGAGKLANIAEATSILKYLMLLTDIKFFAFPPMYVKRIFSGKGNADKSLMINSYKEKYNVDIPKLFQKENNFDSPISDIVDSHAMIYTYFFGDNNEKYGMVEEKENG